MHYEFSRRMLSCLNYCSFELLFIWTIVPLNYCSFELLFVWTTARGTTWVVQTTNSSNEFVSCSFELFFCSFELLFIWTTVHLNYCSFELLFIWTFNIIVQMTLKNSTCKWTKISWNSSALFHLSGSVWSNQRSVMCLQRVQNQ